MIHASTMLGPRLHTGRRPQSCAPILLVEDEPLIAATLCDDLQDHGYAVVHTDNGAEALTMLATGSFHTIITDLRLPGADGQQVVCAARKHDPRARVLVITAFAPEHLEALLRAGAGKVLQKPFLNDRVIEWLRNGA
jgi:CheY-like chemotaxis protein